MSLNTTVLMMASVSLLLSFGLFDFTVGSHLRRFTFFSETDKNYWTGSLVTCEKNNGSLVTVYDEDDVKFLSKNSPRVGVWTGLHKKESKVTTWSDGSSLIYNISQVTSKGDYQICEAMTNRKWKAFNCSDRKPFMCYQGNDYTLIKEEKKDWCQALQYCRRNQSDLVSIRDDAQNDEVSEKGENEVFWIGLQHDQWTWADKSCSTYRNWEKIDQEETCSIFIGESLMTNGCTSAKNPLCTKGNMRIKVIKSNSTWEGAYNYCERNHRGLVWIEDEEDQKAVEEWLKHTDIEGPFWIGLRQSSLFGFWIWRDRTVGYRNWKNDIIPAMPMSNQCGVIGKTDTSWKWSDEDCLREHPFLCEEEIVYI